MGAWFSLSRNLSFYMDALEIDLLLEMLRTDRTKTFDARCYTARRLSVCDDAAV
jgi:hypothetical protein